MSFCTNRKKRFPSQNAFINRLAPLDFSDVLPLCSSALYVHPSCLVVWTFLKQLTKAGLFSSHSSHSYALLFFWVYLVCPFLSLFLLSLVYSLLHDFFYLKWAILGLFYVYFCLFTQTLQFLQQINVKNGQPINCAGIQTHNLWSMGLLPKPLDQGSRPDLMLVRVSIVC